MNQTLTCIALPAPDGLNRGVIPARDAAPILPAGFMARLPPAERLFAPPTLSTDAGAATCEAVPALNAADMGAWHGLSLKTLPPADLARWVGESGFAPPGGESRDSLLRRAGIWLATLPATPARMLVLADATVIRALAIAALGGDGAMMARLDIAPLTRTVLTRHATWRLATSSAPLP
ncbi:phosphoglycerate mutase [Komagataeibacter nataicola]|uniref:Phosphoglycerate mutase n=2 Tax=Komagataeibacter nataicola TaxID=265960 RepID=A0A9N7CC52_9PROT|nr:phosphoglycerate mutase [Komagataeibacter nataicola]PYD65514.1 phosphoglycerate mutase [Komagataeibacter nataicola]GBR16408.1 phosphoglycerate mutase [Komagataeibacter nataicola NRIC 0616]